MEATLLQMSAVFLLQITMIENAPSVGRLSEAEWESYHEMDHQGPGTYIFGYDIEDPANGNVHFRQEERHPNGTVTGSYGVVEADGNVRIVHYVADHKGYRVTMENRKKRFEGFKPANGRQDLNSDTKVIYPYEFNSLRPHTNVIRQSDFYNLPTIPEKGAYYPTNSAQHFARKEGVYSRTVYPKFK